MVMDMPCAFCGQLDRVEEAHIKDEHTLLSQGLNIRAARHGNIIPLCRIHHREYFDYPRRDPNGMDMGKEFQFEPRLIIDFVNNRLILYDNRLDKGNIETLYDAITTVPMFQHAHYVFRLEYVKWKNSRMNERLRLFCYKEGLLQKLTQ